jgi:hypothetical protein
LVQVNNLILGLYLIRINNEDTNQTIDYSKIKSIEKPEGFDEDAPIDEEADPSIPRTEIVYVAGRLFFDHNGRWVYEAFNNFLLTDRFPEPE